MEYLNVSDIYRSTESYIGAKNGIAGTYTAFDIPEGKTIENVTLDGEDATFGIEGDNVFVALYNADSYTVVLKFTDGSEEVYSVEEAVLGDVDGDDVLSMLDVMALLKLVVNGGYSENGDFNADGTNSLIDVIRAMKALVQ